jgi:glycosyltransferase 2 family protein
LGHFLHAVDVFFQHLAAVRWNFLGLALLCHFAKLLFRSYAWRTIVLAAYPEGKLKLRSAFGAYVAGVGVNSVVPVRGGDVVKLYLVKQRIEGAAYTTLAPTLIVETMLDFFVAGAMIVWAMAIGALPVHQVYARLPTVDWKFFVRHEKLTEILLVVLLVALIALFVWARMRWTEFKANVGRGFAILHDRSKLVLQVLLPQTISWVLRLASVFFFLEAFHVPGTVHNALLAQVVDSLATLFPASPGGAGTKQGLTEFLFRNHGISATLLLAFSVGMNIALVVFNLACGLIAIGLMAKTFSFKRLRTASRSDQQAA